MYLLFLIQITHLRINFGKFSVQETEKTMRLLKSSNQPTVKKRQLMQSALGNYRKKMSDEEKRLRAGIFLFRFRETLLAFEHFFNVFRSFLK